MSIANLHLGTHRLGRLVKRDPVDALRFELDRLQIIRLTDSMISAGTGTQGLRWANRTRGVAMRRDEGDAGPPEGGRTWLRGRLVVIALIVAAVLLVVFQNTEDVTLSFLTFDFTMPLWLVLVIFLVLGAVLGQVFEALRARRRRRRRG